MDAKQLIQLVVRSKLIERDAAQNVFDEFLAKGGDPSAAKLLAVNLVRGGLLTKYQANRLLAGRTEGFFLGGCKVLDRLGAGGMGVVYLAEQTRLNRRVALKVLPFDAQTSPEAIKRFYREARAAARLNHPNIVQVFDVNEEAGRHFIIMEYVDGANLAALLKDHGRLSAGQSASLMQQAVAGLQHAHSGGLVHRDIKPGNLMLTGSTLKILDLGLARHHSDEQLTNDETILGTLDYMSPEQCRGAVHVDFRSDYYSLGFTWFCLLVGTPPYSHLSAAGKILAHTSDGMPSLLNLRPDLPRSMVHLIEAMTHKDAGQRLTDPNEILRQISTLSKFWDTATQIGMDLVVSSSDIARPKSATPESLEHSDSAEAYDSDVPLSGEQQRTSQQTIVIAPAPANWRLPLVLAPVLMATVLGLVFLAIYFLKQKNLAHVTPRSLAESQPVTSPLTYPSPTSNDAAFGGARPNNPTVSEGSPGSSVEPDATVVRSEEAKSGTQGNTVLLSPDNNAALSPESVSTPQHATNEGMPSKTTATREPVTRSLTKEERTQDLSWLTQAIDGDRLLVNKDEPLFLTKPVTSTASLTLLGDQKSRGQVVMQPEDHEGQLWLSQNGTVILEHLDLYVDLRQTRPRPVQILRSLGSGLILRNCSVTILAPGGLPADSITLFTLHRNEPADGTKKQTLEMSSVFIRGPGSIVQTDPATTHIAMSDVLVSGTGPLIHAVMTHPLRFADEQLEIDLSASTFDIQQPLLVLTSRPFELRPVPVALSVRTSMVTTLSAASAPPPLVLWDSPVTADIVAETLTFNGSSNIYQFRDVMLSTRGKDSSFSSFVRQPADWTRQSLGSDLQSEFDPRRPRPLNTDWSERLIRELDLQRRLVGQQAEAGAATRNHKPPRVKPRG